MSTRPHMMSAKTWNLIANLEPIANLDRMIEAKTPLSYHSLAFIRVRKDRLKKVSKMTLDEQNKHYRSLGFFK